jgi:hypothetical protein
MERFYPDRFPAFEGEPSPNDFEIAKINDTVGYGIVAKRRFNVGDIVFRFAGDEVAEVTQYSLQLPKGGFLDDPFFMGKALHRCDPNCHVDMFTRSFVARKAIAPGDLVTMNYNQTEDKLFKPFTCACGPVPCGGKFRPGTLIEGASPHGRDIQADWVKKTLEHKTWHFAKTLAHMPHFYTRRREWENSEDFTEVCQYIFDHGQKESFKLTGGYVYSYLYIGHWKYWVMEGNKPAGAQILINRADPSLEY